MTETAVSTFEESNSLEGYRIGVTSHRRAQDLIDALKRRGASVFHAPVLKIAPIAQDDELRRETQAVIESSPDIVVVTTAYGMRRWIEAADATGLDSGLTAALNDTDIYVRGPKARGAVRAAGFDDVGSSPDERTVTLVEQIVSQGVTGKTVAVQMHGQTDVAALNLLEDAGARVISVSPYRWVTPAESRDSVARLIDLMCGGGLDAVTFTAAPAVDALLSFAERQGRIDEVVEVMRRDLVAAAVGPVTAQPLIDVGVEPIMPSRYRLGALVRELVLHANSYDTLRIDTQFGQCLMRGNRVSLGGRNVELTVTQAMIFRALAKANGTVLSRAALSALLSDSNQDHALDMTVSRLRQVLPEPRLVSTVVKRGYRLLV
jgi:uroporphyrinogen-III synthase